MPSEFQSFDESGLGMFIESPLHMRGYADTSTQWGNIQGTSRDEIHTLSWIDFRILRTDTSTLGNVWGIGGDPIHIWGGVDAGTDEFVQEYSHIDLAPIIGRRSADLDVNAGFGCGGNYGAVYFCEAGGGLYTLSPSDFSIYEFADETYSENPVNFSDPDGIGGEIIPAPGHIYSRLYFVDSTRDQIMVIQFVHTGVSPDTWAININRIATAPGTPGGCEGIGGNRLNCWVTNVYDDEIWWYDQDLNLIAGPYPYDGPGSLWGIGGGNNWRT